MSLGSYEARARAGLDLVEVSGRYPIQERDERNITRDVAAKLALGPDDRLLEIGCGPGTLLIPLAFVCAHATGVDNTASLERLESRFAGPPAVETLPGDFLTLELEAQFEAILVYSVLHALPTVEVAFTFAHRAAGLLAPGGRLLIGDLANREKRARFHASPAGVEFQREWGSGDHTEIGAGDEIVGAFDDATIARLIVELRGEGFETYLLPQPVDLPFGHTREDVLVVAPS